MKKYLWELEIEKITSGWQETYDTASRTIPDGEIVAMPSVGANGAEVDRYFYHPVKYRENLINLFNQEKSKALEIVQLKEALNFKDYLNLILLVDIKLFNLLQDWLSPDEYFDGSCFDPKSVEGIMLSNDDYFSFQYNPEHHPDSYKQYLNLKLVNLSN